MTMLGAARDYWFRVLGRAGAYRNVWRLSPPAVVVLAYHEKQMRKEVYHLYDLARKLRNQVNKTDSTEVLSLDMLHTTEEIEKLAKHIRDLARG